MEASGSYRFEELSPDDQALFSPEHVQAMGGVVLSEEIRARLNLRRARARVPRRSPNAVPALKAELASR